MDGDKPSARGIAAYRSAVHIYLSSQAIEPVTFIHLGKAVKKVAYGLGKTASIKAVLSRDPRFSVAESTITLSTQTHSQEQPQQASSRPNPRRPLEEILNETPLSSTTTSSSSLRVEATALARRLTGQTSRTSLYAGRARRGCVAAMRRL